MITIYFKISANISLLPTNNCQKTVSYPFNTYLTSKVSEGGIENVRAKKALTGLMKCGIFYSVDMVPYHYNYISGEIVFIRKSITISILIISFLLLSTSTAFSLEKEKVFLKNIDINKMGGEEGGVSFIFPFTKKIDYITYELDSPPCLIIDLLGNNIFTKQKPEKLIDRKEIKHLKIVHFGKSKPSIPIDLIIVEFKNDRMNYSLEDVSKNKLKLVLGEKVGSEKTTSQKTLSKNQTPRYSNSEGKKNKPNKTNENNSSLVKPIGLKRESSTLVSSKVRSSGVIKRENFKSDSSSNNKDDETNDSLSNTSQIVEPIDYVKSLKEDNRFVIKGTNNGWRLWFENTLLDYEPLQIAQEKVNLAQLKVRKERRNLWPNITIQGSETVGTTKPGGQGEEEYEERRYGLEFNHPLTYGGELRYKLKRAMVNLDISKKEYNRIRADYLNRVKQSYYKLLSPKLDLTVYNNLLEEVRNKFKMIKQQYEKGLITKDEYLSVESILDQIYYRVRTMNEDLEVAKVNFKKELNLDMDTPITIRPMLGVEKVFVDRKKCMRIAVEERPELDINKLIVDFRELNREIAKARENFRISLNGFLGRKGSNYTTEPLEMSNEWQVGLQVTKPFGTSTAKTTLTTKTSPASLSEAGGNADTHRAAFELSLMDQMDQLTQKKSKNIDYMKSLNELSEVKDVISTDVNTAYANYRKALYQLKSAESQISKQKERISILRSRWKAGEANYSNVLNSKLSLARKKTEYNNGLVNYYVALSNLSKACGVDSFHELYELNAIAKIDTEEYMGGLDSSGDYRLKESTGIKKGTLTGHVMALDPNKGNRFVIVNLGKTDGARKGMRLRIYKNDSSVGELKIISLRKNSSSCIVESSMKRKIQLGDIVKIR